MRTRPETGDSIAAAAARSRTEVRLSGSGGQGIILAATLLADAGAQQGREVVQTQSYGPEARGGASKAEVIISDAEIDYPEVRFPDITLCLSQAAFDKYASQSPPGSVVLYDARLVAPRPLEGVRLLGVPFTELAQGELGKVVVANVVAVGSLQRLIDSLSLGTLREAVRRRVPGRFLELNLQALELGARVEPAAFAG